MEEMKERIWKEEKENGHGGTKMLRVNPHSSTTMKLTNDRCSNFQKNWAGMVEQGGQIQDLLVRMKGLDDPGGKGELVAA